MAGMGSPSMGKRQKKTHVLCRRCGKRAYHKRDSVCASCGFGKSKRIRSYAWQTKTGVVKNRK
jgi:large subunit ribosomal protein L37e